MVGRLSKGIGIGQRVYRRRTLSGDGHVTLTDKRINILNFSVNLLLGVIVRQVHTGGVHLLPVVNGVMLCVVDSHPPVGCILPLLG